MFSRKEKGPVLVYCPKCSRQLEVPADYIGQKGECPYCAEKFIIQKPKSAKGNWRKNPWLYALYLFMIFGFASLSKQVGSYVYNHYIPSGVNHNMTSVIMAESEKVSSHCREYRKGLECAMPYFLDRSGDWITDKGKQSEFCNIVRTIKQTARSMIEFSTERCGVFDAYRLNDAKIKPMVVMYSKTYHYYFDLSHLLLDIGNTLDDLYGMTYPTKRHPVNLDALRSKYNSTGDFDAVKRYMFNYYLTLLDKYIELEKEMVTYISNTTKAYE